jgi:hypothetical protein
MKILKLRLKLVNMSRNRRDKLDKYDYEEYCGDDSVEKSKFRRDRDEEIVQKKKVLRYRQQKRRQKRNSRWEE